MDAENISNNNFNSTLNTRIEKNNLNYLDFIVCCAYDAMVLEVMTTPKPGLVDQNNNGSHHDMDLDLFLKSSKAIKPHFKLMAELGFEYEDNLVLPILRKPGIKAEEAMLTATNGVNTHKGLIFSLGLLIGIISNVYSQHYKEISRKDLPQLVSIIKLNSKKLINELSDTKDETHGINVYKNHGIGGVRQEAHLGYPSVFKIGLPSLLSYLKKYDLNLALSLTLLELILVTNDTNVISRGGIKGLKLVRKRASIVLKLEKKLSSSLKQSITEIERNALIILNKNRIINEIKDMDEYLINLHLSPGGAADNLALTIFLAKVIRLIQ